MNSAARTSPAGALSVTLIRPGDHSASSVLIAHPVTVTFSATSLIGLMGAEVIMHSWQDRRVRLDAPQESVARPTEHLPNDTASVAVIDNERGLDRADSASPALCSIHGLNFGHGQSIVLSQPLALIDRAGSGGVRGAPPSEALVSLGSIACCVFRAPAVRAGAAVRAPVAPRFGERRERQSLFAVRADACVHNDTIHQHDQPCHADVLLELANTTPPLASGRAAVGEG
jgi:hypothetical protein